MTRRAKSVLLAYVAVLLVWGFASRADAGRGPAPTCWWEGTVLRAENLPDEWAMTRDPYPIGVTPRPPTYEDDWGAAFTVYFWTRGGPYAALFKPGKQLNDYKPVCVAVPEAIP